MLLTGPSAAPLDLQSLRCFLAAAQRSSFREAARAVGLSPAAFSDRIARLEDELGVTLFERTTRSVRLSEPGLRLVPEAERCLSAAARCFEVAKTPGSKAPFELTLGTRYELGMSFLVPALGKLAARAPERKLHLAFGDTPELVGKLSRDAIDAFISSARLTQPGLAYARLHEEHYALVAARSLIQQKPLRRAADAAAHTLLELGKDLPLFRYFLDARPASEVWAFGDTQYLGSIAPVRERVLVGAGIAVLPLYFVTEDLRQKKLVRLLPSTPLPVDWFRLVWRKGHPREEELQKLAAELSLLPLK